MKKAAFYLLAIIFTISFIACSSKAEKPYTMEKEHGIQVIKNGKKGLNKKLSFSLDKIMEVRNLEDDTTFVLRFPGRKRIQLTALDNDLNLFIVDVRGRRVMKFDSSGEYLNSFGRGGQGPGEFPRQLTSISHKDGLLYVMDRSNRVSIFNPEGKFIEYKNITGKRVRAEDFQVTSKDPVFLCRVFEGDRHADDFKMGQAVFKGDQKFAINTEIYSEMKPFDRQNREAERDFEFNYTALMDGRIVVAPSSKRKYQLNIYNNEGQQISRIEKKYFPQRRDDKFLAAMETRLDKIEERRNMNFQAVSNLKNSIDQIFSDNDNNIWVSTAESIYDQEGQLFEVFDNNGILQGQLRFPELKGMNIICRNNYIMARTSEKLDNIDDPHSEPLVKVFKLVLNKK